MVEFSTANVQDKKVDLGIDLLLIYCHPIDRGSSNPRCHHWNGKRVMTNRKVSMTSSPRSKQLASQSQSPLSIGKPR